jgi:hypothetical protein
MPVPADITPRLHSAKPRRSRKRLEPWRPHLRSGTINSFRGIFRDAIFRFPPLLKRSLSRQDCRGWREALRSIYCFL